MSVKLIPGKPAVTETVLRVISPSTPTKVQVEMNLIEAYLVVSLLGHCNGIMPFSLYDQFREVLDDKTREYCSFLVKEALEDKRIEIVNIQDEFQQVVNTAKD